MGFAETLYPYLTTEEPYFEMLPGSKALAEKIIRDDQEEALERFREWESRCGCPPFVAPAGEETLQRVKMRVVGAADDVEERVATVEDVWAILRGKPFQSDIERAEAICEKFRLVYK